MKVVSNFDLMDNFLCQKAEFASSFVKTLELPTFPRVYSTDGKGWTSLLILAFNFAKSTQILTSPEGLGTTTMGAHQSVGSSIILMTPISNILYISSLVFDNNDRGTFLGVVRAKGLGFSINLISYSPGISPRPLNKSGY